MNDGTTYVRRAPAAAILATPAGRQLNYYLWLLLVVTNIVDVLGTRRAFDLGIGELNPIVAAFYEMFGIGFVAVVKAAFLILLYFLIPYIRSWNRALFMFACSIYLALTFAHIWYLSPLL